MKCALAGIKVGNKNLFWQFWIRGCLRRITDSHRRASGEAPKKAYGKKDFSAALIFHTTLRNNVSPPQPNDFGWTRKAADQWPEREVERVGSPWSKTMPSIEYADRQGLFEEFASAADAPRLE
jgi:hypothetical protein